MRAIGLQENGFSPQPSILEQAEVNTGTWSHMQELMGVRAGSSHEHLGRKLSPVGGTQGKFSFGLLNPLLCHTPIHDVNSYIV